MHTSNTPSPQSAPLLSEYLSKEQLATELEVTVRTVTRWRMMRTAPPAVRIAGRVMFKRSDVEKWIEAQREVAA